MFYFRCCNNDDSKRKVIGSIPDRLKYNVAKSFQGETDMCINIFPCM